MFLMGTLGTKRVGSIVDSYLELLPNKFNFPRVKDLTEVVEMQVLVHVCPVSLIIIVLVFR